MAPNVISPPVHGSLTSVPSPCGLAVLCCVSNSLCSVRTEMNCAAAISPRGEFRVGPKLDLAQVLLDHAVPSGQRVDLAQLRI